MAYEPLGKYREPTSWELAVCDAVSAGLRSMPHGFGNPINAMPLGDVSHVYFIRSGDLLKIGIAADLDKRLDTYLLHNPQATMRGALEVPRMLARQVEKRIHIELAEFARGREWFAMEYRVAKKVAVRHVAQAWEAHDHVDRRRIQAMAKSV